MDSAGFASTALEETAKPMPATAGETNHRASKVAATATGTAADNVLAADEDLPPNAQKSL